MATHCSILAQRIPRILEPGGLQSVGFSRQESWSELPFPFPERLPDPGIKPASPALAGGFFTTELPGKPLGQPHSPPKEHNLRALVTVFLELTLGDSEEQGNLVCCSP